MKNYNYNVVAVYRMGKISYLNKSGGLDTEEILEGSYLITRDGIFKVLKSLKNLVVLKNNTAVEDYNSATIHDIRQFESSVPSEGSICLCIAGDIANVGYATQDEIVKGHDGCLIMNAGFFHVTNYGPNYAVADMTAWINFEKPVVDIRETCSDENIAGAEETHNVFSNMCLMLYGKKKLCTIETYDNDNDPYPPIPDDDYDDSYDGLPWDDEPEDDHSDESHAYDYDDDYVL